MGHLCDRADRAARIETMRGKKRSRHDKEKCVHTCVCAGVPKDDSHIWCTRQVDAHTQTRWASEVTHATRAKRAQVNRTRVLLFVHMCVCVCALVHQRWCRAQHNTPDSCSTESTVHSLAQTLFSTFYALTARALIMNCVFAALDIRRNNMNYLVNSLKIGP